MCIKDIPIVSVFLDNADFIFRKGRGDPFSAVNQIAVFFEKGSVNIGDFVDVGVDFEQSVFNFHFIQQNNRGASQRFFIVGHGRALCGRGKNCDSHCAKECQQCSIPKRDAPLNGQLLGDIRLHGSSLST